MSDDAQIRALVQRWMDATRTGDTQTVLSLMADDAVFLVPGRPPFGKEAFAQAAQAQAGQMAIDGRSDIEEIVVAGDWAFMRSHLTVTMTQQEKTSTRSGYTLTVLRREAGQWKLARDANLLGAAQ